MFFLRGLVFFLVLILGACAGENAVDRGNNFHFVSPGGKVVFRYDPPLNRKRIGPLSGQDLLTPEKHISIKDFPQKVVILSIWAQWCAPCRAEASGLERTYLKLRDKGVVIVGINVHDTRSAAQDFVRKFGLTYPSIFDPLERTLFAVRGFPTTAIPSTIILDREHRVAAIFLHAVTAIDLEKTVIPLTKE